MSPQRPLSGKRFLVTRPEGQGSRLVDGIQALGGEAQHIPFLQIEPVKDRAALQKIAQGLMAYRACIFISANAVNAAWPTLLEAHPNGWPKTVAAATIGPGTARELHARGITEVVMPARRFDSEGLLAEPYFAEAHCRGQVFALIRGEGGRDFLAKTLRARGALVDEVAVYRRDLHPLALEKLQTWVGMDTGTGTMLISSSESLRRLLEAASAELSLRIRSLSILVPHARIAESAQQLGFTRVAICEGGDEGMLRYLQTYNEINLA
jgi:uroporphyrinogen-III synthase